MKSKSAFCLFFLAGLLSVTECFPTGAPARACANVAPNPAAVGGHGAGPQNSDVPYVLTGLPPSGNYTPGMSYTLTLAGNNNEMFRGFLILARNNASQRFGTYTPMANGQTACDDSRGITHTNRDDKSSVSFTWTAPAEGSGYVDFRFAVVQTTAVYWADQDGGVLLEGSPANINLPGILLTMLFATLGVSLMVGF